MKTYKIKLNYEVELKAVDKIHAQELFEENVEDYQSNLATFVSDNLKIEELKAKCGNCNREIDYDGIISNTINRCSRCKDL